MNGKRAEFFTTEYAKPDSDEFIENDEAKAAKDDIDADEQLYGVVIVKACEIIGKGREAGIAER